MHEYHKVSFEPGHELLEAIGLTQSQKAKGSNVHYLAMFGSNEQLQVALGMIEDPATNKLIASMAKKLNPTAEQRAKEPIKIGPMKIGQSRASRPNKVTPVELACLADDAKEKLKTLKKCGATPEQGPIWFDDRHMCFFVTSEDEHKASTHEQLLERVDNKGLLWPWKEEYKFTCQIGLAAAIERDKYETVRALKDLGWLPAALEFEFKQMDIVVTVSFPVSFLALNYNKDFESFQRLIDAQGIHPETQTFKVTSNRFSVSIPDECSTLEFLVRIRYNQDFIYHYIDTYVEPTAEISENLVWLMGEKYGAELASQYVLKSLGKQTQFSGECLSEMLEAGCAKATIDTYVFSCVRDETELSNDDIKVLIKSKSPEVRALILRRQLSQSALEAIFKQLISENATAEELANFIKEYKLELTDKCLISLLLRNDLHINQQLLQNHMPKVLALRSSVQENLAIRAPESFIFLARHLFTYQEHMHRLELPRISDKYNHAKEIIRCLNALFRFDSLNKADYSENLEKAFELGILSHESCPLSEKLVELTKNITYAQVKMWQLIQPKALLTNFHLTQNTPDIEKPGQKRRRSSYSL